MSEEGQLARFRGELLRLEEAERTLPTVGRGRRAWLAIKAEIDRTRDAISELEQDIAYRIEMDQAIEVLGNSVVISGFRTVTRLLAATMAFGDEVAAGDLDGARRCAFRVGFVWACERGVPLTQAHAACLLGARASWAVVDALSPWAVAGASGATRAGAGASGATT
jgi:hypothetical protein